MVPIRRATGVVAPSEQIQRCATTSVAPDGRSMGRTVEFNGASYRVVGVIADTREHNLRGDADKYRFFAPARPDTDINGNFSMRTNASTVHLMPLLRERLWKLDLALVIRTRCRCASCWVVRLRRTVIACCSSASFPLQRRSFPFVASWLRGFVASWLRGFAASTHQLVRRRRQAQLIPSATGV
jgi:hypothetical protein